MGVASGHTECHMTQVQQWRRGGHGGLRYMGEVGPSTTPPLPWGGVQSLYRMFGQDTIVGSNACSVTQDVGRK